MHDDDLLRLLTEVADAVTTALAGVDDWGLAGTVPGQHRSDLVADAAALAVLDRYPVGILSEESGRQHTDREIVVVVDPLDGSTNAAHGIPWYATSLCAVDGAGPRVAVVRDQARGTTWTAVRGQGSRCDGQAIAPSSCVAMGEALVALSGMPAQWLGWRQYRALGAAALDLCLVASGVVDAYLDCSPDAHGPWDYLGGLLVCQEAGAPAVDARGRELVVLGHGDRRTPVAAATPALLAEALDARARLGS